MFPIADISHKVPTMIHESRRVVFPEANVVQLETVEIRDDDLGPYEVVTRTHRTLISPGTELARLQGKLMFDSEVRRPSRNRTSVTRTSAR